LGASAPRKRTDVGYGRPPIEHQFKPGQSGNKRGRPKGSKNEATIIKEILSRKVKMTQNGTTRQISLLEGIHLKFAEDALRGNPKAATFPLSRKQLLESIEQPATATLETDDRTVWDSFMKELQEQFRKEGDNTHE
jgi:hypothetical protein